MALEQMVNQALPPEAAAFVLEHRAEMAAALAVVVVVIALLLRKPKLPWLDASQFKPLPLVEIRTITHNTKLFRFALPSKSMRLGLPTGQHITFLGKDAEGTDVYRPYTPVSSDSQLGFVDFVIKLYPMGKMSQILAKMTVGDQLLMKGPRGRFMYQRNMARAIGMLAGGSGITPMYQVLTTILADPQDRTHVSLIFGNITEQDILIRDELDALAKAHPGRFSLHYVLNQPPAGWAGGVGFVNEVMIKERLPAPADDVMVLRCGPGPMNEAMKAVLDRLGYSEKAQFQF